MPNKTNLNYCKAVVIVHGKSEYLLVQHIKSSLHLPIEIYAKNKGRNSIQINSLMKVLNNKVFRNKRSLLKEYNIETEGKKLKDFKIFSIMDTDDCDEDKKKKYINQEMFKEHELSEYITPIYNINNLEDVIKKSKIYYEKINDKDKSNTYIKLFPQESKKIVEQDDVEQLDEMCKKLEKVDNTNLEVLIRHCLSHVKLLK